MPLSCIFVAKIAKHVQWKLCSYWPSPKKSIRWNKLQKRSCWIEDNAKLASLIVIVLIKLVLLSPILWWNFEMICICFTCCEFNQPFNKQNFTWKCISMFQRKKLFKYQFLKRMRMWMQRQHQVSLQCPYGKVIRLPLFAITCINTILFTDDAIQSSKTQHKKRVSRQFSHSSFKGTELLFFALLLKELKYYDVINYCLSTKTRSFSNRRSHWDFAWN